MKIFRRETHFSERVLNVFLNLLESFFRENLCGGRCRQMVGYWIRSDLADKEHPNLPAWEEDPHGKTHSTARDWEANVHVPATGTSCNGVFTIDALWQRSCRCTRPNSFIGVLSFVLRPSAFILGFQVDLNRDDVIATWIS